jgi:hypothetical protein
MFRFDCPHLLHIVYRVWGYVEPQGAFQSTLAQCVPRAPRSLFEKDKLLFALLLATKLGIDSGRVSPQELRFLLTGGIVRPIAGLIACA